MKCYYYSYKGGVKLGLYLYCLNKLWLLYIIKKKKKKEKIETSSVIWVEDPFIYPSRASLCPLVW